MPQGDPKPARPGARKCAGISRYVRLLDFANMATDLQSVCEAVRQVERHLDRGSTASGRDMIAPQAFRARWQMTYSASRRSRTLARREQAAQRLGPDTLFFRGGRPLCPLDDERAQRPPLILYGLAPPSDSNRQDRGGGGIVAGFLPAPVLGTFRQLRISGRVHYHAGRAHRRTQ